MNKIKKFIKEKGGIKAIIITIALVLIASALIITGVVYAYYDGEWSRIGELFTSRVAITIYIVIGLIIVLAVNLYIIMKRNKEVK